MKQYQQNGFQFKQFFVAHDRSPMKVTTDSILLGAWTSLHKPERILDIGTGCGVIALMLAQRLHQQSCLIEAIDIDANAVAQCQHNSQQSPFADIQTQQIDLQRFTEQAQVRYDLLVSNPPYFNNSILCRDPARQLARSTESLTHQQLLSCAKQLAQPDAHFCLVLPFQLAADFMQLAQQTGWYVTRSLQVRHTLKHPYSLQLLDLVQQPTTTENQSLAIRDAEQHYSTDFSMLLQPFLLHL